MTDRPAATHTSVRALVVDDRGDVAISLGLLLSQLGCLTQVAYRAHEAIKKGEALRPDVIFLDIGLPDLSGYDVCKEIRQTEWGLNAFIVALTARNEPEDILRSANSGFDRHVGKPMNFSTLQEIMTTVKTRHALAEPQPEPGKDQREMI